MFHTAFLCRSFSGSSQRSTWVSLASGCSSETLSSPASGCCCSSKTLASPVSGCCRSSETLASPVSGCCRSSKTLASPVSCSALQATTTSPELDRRRLLGKAGGARVQSRALYEAAGGGAGPAGSQRHPRRLSRQAGGCSLRPSAATRGGGRPRAKRGRDGLQKAGQLAEMAQKWPCLSLAVMLILKVVGATWKQCTPVAAPPE